MEPIKFAKTIYDLVAFGGYGFISTPYHGYLAPAPAALLEKARNNQAVAPGKERLIIS